MKRNWESTLLAALLLFLGGRTFWHLADIVPWGPPVLPANLLRISPAVATTTLFLITGVYGVALLLTAFGLARLKRWAGTTYVIAAAAFSANYLSVFAFVVNDMALASTLVFVVLFAPIAYLGWWVIRRQFKQLEGASSNNSLKSDAAEPRALG